jgi:hypothetical protein
LSCWILENESALYTMLLHCLANGCNALSYEFLWNPTYSNPRYIQFLNLCQFVSINYDLCVVLIGIDLITSRITHHFYYDKNHMGSTLLNFVFHADSSTVNYMGIAV